MTEKQIIATSRTLGKSERLKSHRLISRVFKEGKAIVSGPFRIIYNISSSPLSQPLQAGFSVSKRNFKKATDRNRIKRLMREAYRVNKPAFQPAPGQTLAVFILYTGKELPDFHFTQEKISAAMRILTAKAEQHISSE